MGRGESIQRQARTGKQCRDRHHTKDFWPSSTSHVQLVPSEPHAAQEKHKHSSTQITTARLCVSFFSSTKLRGSHEKTCDNIKRLGTPARQPESTMTSKRGMQAITFGRHYEENTAPRLLPPDGNLRKTALTERALKRKRTDHLGSIQVTREFNKALHTVFPPHLSFSCSHQ